MRAIFQKMGKKRKKMFKKNTKWHIIWKFGQKCTKFENILKKVKWLCEIIACNKLLEKALEHQTDKQKYFFIMYIRTKYDKTESSSKNGDKGKFPQGES